MEIGSLIDGSIPAIFGTPELKSKGTLDPNNLQEDAQERHWNVVSEAEEERR